MKGTNQSGLTQNQVHELCTLLSRPLLSCLTQGDGSGGRGQGGYGEITHVPELTVVVDYGPSWLTVVQTMAHLLGFKFLLFALVLWAGLRQRGE